jgi:hypothetical protein
MSDFIRLRQVALAVPGIEEAEATLCRLFGVAGGHRDERVRRYGLANAVLTFGTTFVELLAPVQADTAVGRFLERSGSQTLHGAYMVIFDCSDLAQWRARIAKLGVRIVNERTYPRYCNMQLHPKDTGGTFVEIHQNVGGEDLKGHYDPAGDGWVSTIRDTLTLGIVGAGLESSRPEVLARRWSGILGRESRSGRMELDAGILRFDPSHDGGERLAEIHVQVRDIGKVIANARAMDCTRGPDWVVLGGVRFRLSHDGSVPR